MKPRLVVRDADLEIRPMPQKRVPSPEAIERTLSQPAWWSGAANMREDMYREDRSPITELGIHIARRLEAAPDLRGDNYRDWLAVSEHFQRLRAVAEWRQGAR